MFNTPYSISYTWQRHKTLYLNLRNVRVSEIAEDVDSVNLSGVIKIEFSRVQVTFVCQFHVVQNKG